MNQPAVGAETFVLKTNIYSRASELRIKKFLEDIQGVHRIFIDPTEIGKITILGTIDPRKLMKILRNNGIKSEQVFEPRNNLRDLPNVSGPKSPVERYHVTIDKEAVEGLEALSKLKGFETVDLSKNGMKLSYKKDENVQHLDGKNRSCSRNMHEDAMHKKGKHVMNTDCHDFHGNYESDCSRNQGMYVQYCHGCGTNCEYMAPHEGISIGIPSSAPEYIPSAPTVPVNQGMYVQYCHGCRTNCGYMAPHEGISIGIPSSAPEYIPSTPTVPVENDPDPRSRKPSSDHDSTNKYSTGDNPTGFVVFFLLFFFILLIHAALS